MKLINRKIILDTLILLTTIGNITANAIAALRWQGLNSTNFK